MPEKQALETPASPFDFGLRVQTVTRDERETPNPENSEESKEKIERLPVLEGLRKYAFDEKTRQLLLVGRPGSGKSTALVRLLLEEATLTPNPSPNFGRGEVKAIPVLVELRYWQTSITALMLDFFRRHRLNLSEAELENLLNAKRVLVLMDGVNELPTEEARSQLEAFRRQYPRVPAIFTTRDLSLGGDVGIEKKLEMQPLTEAQMQAFVRAYLPECGEAMWRQLQGRVREFGKTPLLLWMLCEVVQLFPNAQLPSNLGGIFQAFTRSYEVSSVRKHAVAALKGDVRPLSDRRLWCKALKHLAEVMMRGEKPVDFRVVIERSEAERELEKLFQKEPSPPKTARDCLDDLLKYHLLQIKTGNEIEFRHQLIQEYYAAEALRERLPGLSDGELKREYLNYLKWTEPVALMLALVGEETQAVRVVRLALEVDGMLGARLAGEVKREFQQKALDLINVDRLPNGSEVSDWLRVELLGRTRSRFALPILQSFLNSQNLEVVKRATFWLGFMGYPEAVPSLRQKLSKLNRWIESPMSLEDYHLLRLWKPDFEPEQTWKKVSQKILSLEIDILEAIAKLSPQDAILKLRNLLPESISIYFSINSCDSRIHKLLGNIDIYFSLDYARQILEECNNPNQINQAAELILATGKLDEVTLFTQRLNYESDLQIRKSLIEALGMFDTPEAVGALVKLLEDPDSSIQKLVINTLIKRKPVSAIEILIPYLNNTNANVRWYASCVIAELHNSAAIPVLLERLQDEHLHIRRTAVELLGKLENDRVIPSLIAILEDPDDSIRRSAAISLANLNREEAIPELIKALYYYPQRGYRDPVVKALGKFGTNEIVMQHLTEALNQGLKAAAIPLGMIGKEEAIPTLLELLRDPSQTSFKTQEITDALVHLISLGHTSIIETLISNLENINSIALTDPYFRNRVVIVLLSVDPKTMAEYLPPLIRLLSTEVGEHAVWAISTIQANCKFYNYDIFRSPPIQKPSPNSSQPSSVYNIHNPEAVTIVEKNDGEVITQQISKAE
ncbi:MAG TPA: HEAT repeat domain-containing protein [Oscillatoriales cyanobacterium M4454_W2019_049]|nr:HEAT repeat domain-containing protein [Oscillatoriales cyanobacterium M4454_W2019_049]